MIPTLLAYILRGLTLGLSAAAIPGPFQAFLLAQTLKDGWQRSLPLVLAPLVSDGPIIVLVLFVLAQTPGWFLNALQVAGGLFVLYLAYGAYLAVRTTSFTDDIAPEPSRQNFAKAVLVSFLNPGPYIFWSMVSGPILLEGWRQAPGLGVGFVTSFYGAFVGILICFVILFATARRFGPPVRRALSALSAMALLILGLYQLWSGLTG